MLPPLKIALGQIEVQAGRPDLNAAAMLELIQKAQGQADLLIFPELSLSGVLIGDLWEQNAFLQDCQAWGEKIIAASQDLAIIFGNVAVDWNQKGLDGRPRKFNAFFAAAQGKLWGAANFPYPFRIKSLPPNYRDLEDNRYFCSLKELAAEQKQSLDQILTPIQMPLQGQMTSIGALIGEDSWSGNYAENPAAILAAQGAELLINLAASPFSTGKIAKRKQIFAQLAQQTKLPVVAVNAAGIQNNGKNIYTFDGSSVVFQADGQIWGQAASFSSDLKVVDLQAPPLNLELPEEIALRTQALLYGLQKFLAQIGIKKVVVGLSGGIDSAVSAALFRQILAPENLLLINMPSRFNSQTTQNLSRQLAQNLGCLYTVLPIGESLDYTVQQLNQAELENLSTGQKQHLEIKPFITENIQARDRSARILAAAAAAFGGAFSCNANKSETTIGYGTMYGDLAGFLAPLADLWKFQVYETAHYLNAQAQTELIPAGIIEVKPSAELSPEQAVDEGKGDPLVYPYHDYLFRSWIESWSKPAPEDLLLWYQEGTLAEKIGCEPALVGQLFPTPAAFIQDLERWWNLFNGLSVAKRIQTPPILTLSRRAFGSDYREAQNGVYYTQAYLKLKQQLLMRIKN